MPFIILLFLSGNSLIAAQNLYEQGKKLYFSKGCNGCHGVNAKGVGEYPGLAYRPKQFLTYKLNRYRKKQADTQQAQLMIPFALKLTDQQVDALTTFFSEFKENTTLPTREFSTRGDGGS